MVGTKDSSFFSRLNSKMSATRLNARVQYPWRSDTNRLLTEKNGYRIEKQIGFGACSMIYFVRKRVKGHEIRLAMQFINLEKCTPSYKTRFVPRELEVLKGLHHKYLIPIQQIIIHPDRLKIFIFMGLAKSDLLKEIDRGGKIGEFQAKVWLRQVFEGLAHLHKHRWAHRDLRVEHILITFSNKAVIADLPFARQMKSSEHSNTYCGAVMYAPPEVLNHATYNPYSADIWSMGVIVFAVMTGFMIFSPEDPATNHRAIKKEQPTARQRLQKMHLEESVSQLILACLEVQPEKRAKVDQCLEMSWLQVNLKNAERKGEPEISGSQLLSYMK